MTIDQLKDNKTNEPFYPLTHIEAVIDDDNVNLESKLNEINNKIDKNNDIENFYQKQYFTTEALEDGTISFRIDVNVDRLSLKFICYSKDNGKSWNLFENQNNKDNNITITVNVKTGDKILWKGSGLRISGGNGSYSFFSSTCRFNVYGNIMSLLYCDEFDDKFKLIYDYTFAFLFSYEDFTTSIVDASNLILPATTLSKLCYNGMFSHCHTLEKAPKKLPATILTNNCYTAMFHNCTSLTEAPELPALTLVDGCYTSMFYGCQSLNYIKALFLTNPNIIYTQDWVYNVAPTGTFIKNSLATWSDRGDYAVPEGWSIYDLSGDELHKHYENEYLTIIPRSICKIKLNLASLYSKDGAIWNSLAANTEIIVSPVSLETAELDYTNKVSVDLNSQWQASTSYGSGLTNANYNFYESTSNYSSAGVAYMDITISGLSYFEFKVRNRSYDNIWVTVSKLDMLPDISQCNDEKYIYYTNKYKNTNNANKWNTVSFKNISKETHKIRIFCYTTTALSERGYIAIPKIIEYNSNLVCNNGIRFKASATSNIKFTIIGEYDVEGNVMSLIYGDNFRGQTSLGNYPSIFRELLYSSQVIDASNLILPSTTLTNYCYAYMFKYCQSLVKAPELPATTLANYCYQYMFQYCTSLTEAPALPATTLANYCYVYMFDHCTSLVKAPELPATTLANYCYQDMFSYCKSLTKAPKLPATTLATYCYYYMFSNCTSLIEAPKLPATTLVDNCYSFMFSNCSNLNYIKAFFTTTPDYTYTQNWVGGVAAIGTFVRNSSATWLAVGDGAIPQNWEVIPNITPNGDKFEGTIYIPGKGKCNVYEKTLSYNTSYNTIDTNSLPNDCIIIGGSIFNDDYCEELNSYSSYRGRYSTRYGHVNGYRNINITNITNDFIPTYAKVKYISDNPNKNISIPLNSANVNVIDLGLPSGTLWCTTDIDGSSYSMYSSYNSYYRYGGLVTYYEEYYVNADYYTGTEDPLKPSRDIARKMWKYPVHIPTATQWQELFDNCSYSILYNYFPAFSKNNNQLVFNNPTGYVSGGSSTMDNNNYYLTSTPTSSSSTCYVAKFGQSSPAIVEMSRNDGYFVRGVVDIADVETYVG